MNSEEAERDEPIRVTWEDIKDIKERKTRAEVEAAEPRTMQESSGAEARRSKGKTCPPVRSYGKISGAKSTAQQISASRRVLLSTPFYTCVAGAVGALVGWGLTEVTMTQDQMLLSYGKVLAHVAVWFAVIGAAVGASLGAVESVMSRSFSKALIDGVFGFAVGLVGCAVGGVVAQLLYTLLLLSAGKLSLSSQMFARTLGWGVAGIFLGVAQGAAARSGKKTLNGLLGGLGGGLAGGLLFDPIGLLTGGIRGGLVSRLIGLLAIGAAVGVLIGLVEQLLKDAWLYIIKGQLAGKQFVIYRNPTVLGSSPKCEIYLFKDETVDPRHAAIHTVNNRYEIQDLGSRAGTFVNGRRVNRLRLGTGDEIRIGTTVLRYSEKRRERQ